MIKGIYVAASAMIAGVNKQTLKVHNIANLDTPGFKQIFTTLQEFQVTDVFAYMPLVQNPRQQSIGRLGLGVMTGENRTKFNDGALQATNQPYDFAIQGDGFFRLKTPEGERYTRDGRFLCDPNGSLFTIDGFQVLDISGNPIQVFDSEPGSNLCSLLGIAEFDRPEIQLQKDGSNLYTALETPPSTISNSTIHQGFLEMSNVNVVDMMIGSGVYEAAQKMIQIQDQLLGKSISTLGKTA
jgi:flagellar basal-body rod protein FlgF